MVQIDKSGRTLCLPADGDVWGGRAGGARTPQPSHERAYIHLYKLCTSATSPQASPVHAPERRPEQPAAADNTHARSPASCPTLDLPPAQADPAREVGHNPATTHN